MSFKPYYSADDDNALNGLLLSEITFLYSSHYFKMALGPNILNTTPNQQARIDDLKKKKTWIKVKKCILLGRCRHLVFIMYRNYTSDCIINSTAFINHYSMLICSSTCNRNASFRISQFRRSVVTTPCPYTYP